ncbi:hypothetical protein [Nocardioides antri]|uniref:Uncharacterized protein n=1 Tax=Nocardioides antri TaxID=2607659 RepID=A0A5B1M8S6_9ACTN|nr:hypothetical protein [Nocardioides antri]KAA1428938.1 hypothetical protein F0U47_01620 [Nocardioides antri]
MTTHRLVLPVLGAVIGSSLSVLGVAPSAHAAPDPTTALGLPAGVTAVTTGSGVVTNRLFNDFPSQGADYYVLSTGLAGSVFPASPDPDAQLSTDLGGDGEPDSSSITLTVEPSAGVRCLFVDFALGTEEPVQKYTETVPGDQLTVVNDGVDYATNAGRGYFNQAAWPAEPKPYMVNAVKYWHHPGDPLDPVPGTAEEPWLPEATALNSVTTRDTARVPLDFANGAETVEIEIADALNGDLDSVAMLDDVRLGSSCSAGTGVEPNPVHDGGVIAGIRGVGNALVYDPIPSTDSIERYDDPGNGWRSPSGVPVELRFRWYRTNSFYALSGDMTKWAAIPDADRQAYVPTAGDEGHVLIVLVTGVVDGRRYETYPSTGESARWYVTTPIANGTFVEGEAPVITGPSDGSAAAGDVLTAQIGHTVPREDTWTWRWYADGSAISGASGQSLTLAAGHAGKTITVVATAKRLNFDDKAWTSAPYGPIELQTWTSTGTPSIVVDGVAEYGKTLAVDPGVWTPTPERYSYQWLRNGSVISGSNFANYTIRAEDVGARISVAVTGSKAGFAPVPKESAAVDILGATMAGATPVVTGTPKVGQRLNGSVTDWDPNGSSLTYSWFAGTTLLEEGSSYLTVPPSAVGQPIVLKVTGRRPGYTPRTVASAPTAPVTPGQLTVGQPFISGYAKVGETLTVSPGYWGPEGVKLSYRWKIGTNRVTGRKGARSTFVIPRAARGKRITVSVTGSLLGYETVKRTSPPTARVIR